MRGGAEERRRGGEEGRRGGENERMGRRGGVPGDAGSGNPGRRPRVPASFIINCTLNQLTCDYFDGIINDWGKFGLGIAQNLYDLCAMEKNFLHCRYLSRARKGGGGQWRKMAKNGEKWRWQIRLFHLSNSPFFANF